jgi:polyvinyl alcohol dehydrogenase (cytochrome)
MIRRLAGAAATAVPIALAALPTASAAANPPGCAAPLPTGGEWRSYGGDLSNTRDQSHEKVLSASDAPLLATAWTFSTAAHGATGDFTGTPIAADGCVYAASTRGWVFAINADTGKLVWKTPLPLGGGVNGSVAVAQRALSASKPAARRPKRPARHRPRTGKRSTATSARARKGKRRPGAVHGARRTAGTVYIAVSRTQKFRACPPGDPCTGPYVVALDQATGKLVWSSKSIDTQQGADEYASPIIYDGVLMIGVSGGAAELGPESGREAFEGSMNFLDANNGRLLKKTWTIHPPKHPNDDYAGAAIWSTPAIDTAGKVAFVGAGNPFNPHAEAPHADSVLKFNVNRKSRHFGEIIGSYKGTVDTYVKAFQQLPCVDTSDPTNNSPPYYPQGAGSCGQIDMDFGSSPNLLRDGSGHLLVGAGQKSGVYHVFDAKTLKPVWQGITGIPSSVGGIVGSTATDGQAIYGPDTIPGYVWSLSQAKGDLRWVGPISDGAHWGPPVAYANGAVYSVDFSGFLDVFDGRNGALMAKRPLTLGGGAPSISWGGVSIARHTIYASVGVLGLANGFIEALRPGSVSDLAGNVGDTVNNLASGGSGGGGGGGAPVGPSVVAGPGAASAGYVTPAIVSFAGGKLSFLNLDIVQHDVTADDKGPGGRPLFQSKLIGLGESAGVDGAEKLPPGSYTLHCSVHPGMHGTLVVH